MATEVKYIKDSNTEQMFHEKNMIVDVLRAKVKSSSGRLRSIKLPKYIFFRIKADSTLSISIKEMEATIDGNKIMKNPVCENMQEDNAAFEGWAICLKSWLTNIGKVELSWDIPSEITLKRGSSEQHYNRFCYRVLRFKEAYPEWFEISNDNKNEIEKFAKRFNEIRNNAYSKEPEHKPSHSGFGETDMEFAMANDFSSIMKSHFNIGFIDRQFPVGLKKADKQFFTGGLSAIDLWGTKDDVLSIIELKYIPKSGSKNIKVGIISELFLYSCVMRDIAIGVIHEPSTPVVKETEKLFYKNANKYRKVCAYMLANEYHPLVENKKVFSILNSNALSSDMPVFFQQCHYIYNETTKQLSITE
ncbi:MAG: hypothetical protein KBT29_03120 [Prevotellaceae bacterium]|nr:hypothetical protein [Candidatus Minthosoma caballi]